MRIAVMALVVTGTIVGAVVAPGPGAVAEAGGAPVPAVTSTVDVPLVNPGFEQPPTGAGDPAEGWTAWSFGGASAAGDTAVAHSGGASVRIDAPSPADAHVEQVVAVEPGTMYRLSGWVRTEAVAHGSDPVDAGANLSVQAPHYDGRTADVFGTADWTFVSLVFPSGPSTQLTIALRVGYFSGTTTGTAWFDDVRLTAYRPDAAAPVPGWRFLVLVYPEVEVTTVDAAGVEHVWRGSATADDLARETERATRFVLDDLPRLTSGAVAPTVTVRYPERVLRPSDPWDLCGGDPGFWPSPADTAPELDPAFDSVIVAWWPRLVDTSTGAVWYANGCVGGLTYGRGLGPTYNVLLAAGTAENDTNTNVYRHEFGHAALWWFEATGLPPAPTVTNEPPSPDFYVHCPTGEPYVWVDETQAEPVPGSTYNVDRGFTHDYLSGTVALATDPTRCLGLGPAVWGFGGPVHNVLSELGPTGGEGDDPGPTAVERRLEALDEKVRELVDDGVLRAARARPLLTRIDRALHAVWVGRPAAAVRALDRFVALVEAAVRTGRLPAADGAALVAGAREVTALLGGAVTPGR